MDSSSAILLYRCGVIRVLLENSCCVMPLSVRDELTVRVHEGAEFFTLCFEKGLIRVEDAGNDFNPGISLHKGERDVISLFAAGSGDYIVIDDGRGAAYCRSNGIPYINALLAVKILNICGKTGSDETAASYNNLKEYGRYSSAVIDWAEMAGADELKFFLL